MKQLFLVAALGLGAVGCADSLRPIQIRDAKPVDATCAEAGDISQYAGSVDLTSLDNGVAPETFVYVKSFTVASQLEATSVEVNGAPVADEARNNFIVEEIEFNYTSTPARTFATERAAAYFVIPVGSQENKLNISLIQPKALQTVKELVDSTGAPATLLATFRLKGKLASGVSNESDEVTFPITVLNSGKTCPTPVTFEGTCGGVGSGIDTPFTCTAPPATP